MPPMTTNRYDAINGEEVYEAAFRPTSAIRRSRLEEGQPDSMKKNTRNEELLSDSLDGSNLDLGEFPYGMKDSTSVSQVDTSCLVSDHMEKDVISRWID